MSKATTTLLRFLSIVFILSSAKEDGITIISNLLALHKENCGKLPLCAFNKWYISADVTNPCCFQCSCHKDCSKDDVCCLDNWILEEKNLNHTDVIAYREFIQNVNGNLSDPSVKDDNGTDTEVDVKGNRTDNYFTIAKLILRAYDSIQTETGNQRAANSSTRTNNSGLQHCNGIPNMNGLKHQKKPERGTICVSSKLKNHDIYFSHPWNDVGYEMITSCFTNATDQDKIDQCANLTITSNMDPRKLIPVTSMTSLETYRNVYCLQCNEGDHKNFSVWKTWYTCGRSTVSQQEMEPDKWWLIDMLLLSCNIAFEPSELVKNFVFKCKQYDTEPCSRINGVLEIDMDVLEHICNCFYPPVFQINKTVYKVYRNVACYLCNRERFLGKSCSSTFSPNKNYQLEINTKVSFDNDQDARINQLFSTNCTFGFIYDKITNSCRRVFCPRNFINFKGVCTPFLLETRNVFYSVVLAVKVKTQLVSDVGLLDELQSNFVNQMRTDANYKFSESSVSVWREDGNRYMNIILNVKPNHEAYYKIINNIDDFIWQLFVYHVRGKLVEDETELNIPGERLMPSFKIRKRLSELNISDSAGNWKEIEFRLDDSFFCLRVELNGREIQRQTRWTFKLLSGKLVADPEVISHGILIGYLICIKDVFPDQLLWTASVLTPHPDVLANTTQGNVVSSQPLTSPFLVVVVLLFVVVVVLVVRKCLRYRLCTTNHSNT